MNIIKSIPTSVTQKLGRHALKAQAHSPAILMGVGIVGAVTSTVLACRATLRLDDIFIDGQMTLKKIRETNHDDYSEEDKARDKAIVLARMGVKVGKLYAPSVILGIASIGALITSNRILVARNAGLMALAAGLEKKFGEYRGRVIEEIGEDRENKILHSIKEVSTVDPDTGKVEKGEYVTGRGGSVYARLFDQVNSRQWSKEPGYNQMWIRCQQNHANDLLVARGHVFLNEVYDMLGLSRTEAGALVGWIHKGGETDGDGYIDFGLFRGDVYEATRFVNGDERSVWLDFNVDGIIYNQI